MPAAKAWQPMTASRYIGMVGNCTGRSTPLTQNSRYCMRASTVRGLPVGSLSCELRMRRIGKVLDNTDSKSSMYCWTCSSSRVARPASLVSRVVSSYIRSASLLAARKGGRKVSVSA
jgi:hypothetical protein